MVDARTPEGYLRLSQGDFVIVGAPGFASGAGPILSITARFVAGQGIDQLILPPGSLFDIRILPPEPYAGILPSVSGVVVTAGNATGLGVESYTQIDVDFSVGGATPNTVFLAILRRLSDGVEFTFAQFTVTP